MIDIVNGSSTPNVTGGRLSAGSGRFSHSSRRPWNAYVTANAATTATRQMIRRARSSPRCSTSVASSPWRRRRGSRLIAYADGRRSLVRRPGGGNSGLLVIAGDRVLELAHAATERTSDLGQSLRPEDEQRDDQEDDQPRDSDLRHASSVAGSGGNLVRVPFRGLAWAVLLGAAFAAVVSARGAGSSTQIVFAADHRPALDGEIYRVDMNGKRVDLSRSPYADTQETVSPDGKRLAFLSVRSGSSQDLRRRHRRPRADCGLGSPSDLAAAADSRLVARQHADRSDCRHRGRGEDLHPAAAPAAARDRARVGRRRRHRGRRVVAGQPGVRIRQSRSRAEPVVRVVGATGKPAFTRHRRRTCVVRARAACGGVGRTRSGAERAR